MPRLWNAFPRSVFFLYGTNPRTGEIEGPVGSGLFIGYPATRTFYSTHIYAVTAHHCLLEGGHIIRLNTHDGRSRTFETEPQEWVFDPNGSDVAVLDVTDHINQLDDNYSALPTSLLATKDFFKEVDLGIGEDGCMLGLLSDQPGKNRNLIAYRTGSITLLASDDDPVKQPNGNFRPSHLFDIRSRPGFSGSPVFVYRTLSGDLRNAVMRGLPERVNPLSADDVEENTFLMLLGIHAGQYYDAVKARRRIADGEGRREDDILDIPSSVTIVVPVWEFMPLFEQSKLADQRMARERESD